MSIKSLVFKAAFVLTFSCCYLLVANQGHGWAPWPLNNRNYITQNPSSDQAAAIRQLEKVLLGNIYISQIAPADLPLVYETFIRNIQDKSKTWAATDWQNAEHIMNKLHFRRKTLQNQISAADISKITRLQGQYRSLKAEKSL